MTIPAHSTPSRLWRSLWVRLGLPTFVLFAVATAWLWKNADRDLRAGWLEHARLVQQALPPHTGATLTGTPRDLENPSYLQLKSRLARLRADTPDCRFVYLIGRHSDRTVFFYADSEPAGSKDESVAGDVYPEASPLMHAAFDHGSEGVYGPESDSFGRWVTAVIPLSSLGAHEDALVLGMDIDARKWSANVTVAILPPLALGLMLAVAGGMIIYAARSRHRLAAGHSKSLSQQLVLSVGPVISIGILITFALLLWNQQNALNKTRLTDQRLLQEISDLRRLDESLTASARLATHDPGSSWAARHRSDAAQLDDLLASAGNLNQGPLSELIAQISALSGTLRKIEARALALADAQDPMTARALLEDPAFLAAKDACLDAIQRLQQSISRRIDQSLDSARLQGWRETGFLAAAVFIVTGAWLVLYGALSQRNRAEARNLELLAENTRHLEATVESRTRALSSSEHRFRALFETMAQGAVTQDAQGTIIEANFAATRILGLSLDQLLGRTSMDPRWHLTDVNGQPLSVEEHPSMLALRTGRPVLGVTLAVFNPELDTTRWLMVDSTPQFSADSLSAVPSMTHTVFTDITERVAAERAREAQRRALEFIIESDISGYWEWDVVRNTAFLSPASKRMLGYADHELPNETDTWQRHIHPDDLARALAGIERHFATRGQEPYYVEVRYRHKNGGIVWVICSGGVPEWLPDGSPARMVGCHINITPAKESEAQLVATNHLLAEAKIKADLLSLVATRTTNSVIITDAHRRVTWVNEGFTRITGYSLEEVMGKSPGLILQCPATNPATVVAMRAAFDQGQAFHGEILNRNKNGRDYWLELDLVPLRDATGVLTGFVGIQLDITERKLAETLLAEQAERTSVALDAGQLGLWDWHIPSGHTLFDERWAAMLGEDFATLSSHMDEWSCRCHPNDHPTAHAALHAHFKGETDRYQCQHRMMHRDGTWRWIMDTGKVVSRDAEGNPLRMIGTHQDITDEHLAEIELVRRADALNHVGRLAHVGSWEVDLPTQTISWSDQVSTLHEVSPDYVPEMATAIAFYPGDAATTITAAVQAAIDHGTPFDLELPFITARGKHLRVRTLGEAYYENGLILGIRGALQDVTEIYLQREALAAARDAAQKANDAKSLFLANMSHEIRTPMNGVLGMAHLLLSSQLDDTQRHYVQTIQTSGQSLVALINDILDLSKIEAGRFDLSSCDFAAGTLLRDFLVPLRVQAQSKGIVLACELPSDLPPFLNGDPARLRQILTNLVGNAIKFTSVGEVALHVSVLPLPPGARHAHHLRFAVRDTGPGIPANQRDRLFKKFSQIDASYTREFGGTGLGLAISRELVGLMGGLIGVDSEEGRGSTFWFTIPFQAASNNASSALVAAPAAAQPSALNSNARLLLVEDNATNRLVALGLLGKFGLKADVALNGREALDALAAKDYDLVLMDIQMPVMDGMAATRAIRDPATGLSNPSLPIIAMTAHAFLGDRAQGLAAGFSDYITKPIDPAAFKATLLRWLPQTTPTPTSAPTPRPVPAPPKQTKERPINLTELKERLMGDEIIMEEILAVFVSDLERQLQSMRNAAASADYPALAMSAHTLKGSAANLSAEPLRAAAAALETAALAKDSPAALNHVTETLLAAGQLLSALAARSTP